MKSLIERLGHLPRDARDTLFLLLVIALVLAPQLVRLPLWCSALALAVLLWRAVLAWNARPLPSRWWLLGLLAADHRSHVADPQHLAGSRRRRDLAGSVADAQDAGVARTARCLCGVFSQLLHDADQLLLLAVTADGSGDAGGFDGPAHGPGQHPHAGGQTTAARGSWHCHDHGRCWARRSCWCCSCCFPVWRHCGACPATR